jgi:hypothetical protein
MGNIVPQFDSFAFRHYFGDGLVLNCEAPLYMKKVINREKRNNENNISKENPQK